MQCAQGGQSCPHAKASLPSALWPPAVRIPRLCLTLSATVVPSSQARLGSCQASLEVALRDEPGGTGANAPSAALRGAAAVPILSNLVTWVLLWCESKSVQSSMKFDVVSNPSLPHSILRLLTAAAALESTFAPGRADNGHQRHWYHCGWCPWRTPKGCEWEAALIAR